MAGEERLTEEGELRALLGEPEPRAWAKEIDRLDGHCRELLARAPLAVLATADADGTCDASPRGGPPGFLRVLGERRLAWGELPSNRRADSLRNLLVNPAIALLVLVPGLDETLRVNGTAFLSRDPELLEAVALDGRVPRLVVAVDVEVCFLQYAKALRRGRVWSPEDWPDLAGMASPAQMLRDHRDHRDDGATVEQVRQLLDRSYAERVW